MSANQTDQHQNMPDPLDFTPGDKIQSNPTLPNAIKVKSNVRLWRYALPMAINLILFYIIQTALGNACKTLPKEAQGECGAAWISFFVVLPLEVLVFTVCLIVMIIGFIRWAK